MENMVKMETAHWLLHTRRNDKPEGKMVWGHGDDEITLWV